MAKVSWQEVPSVRPGGKKSFFVTITPQGKRTVVWDRIEEKWAVQGDQEGSRGDSPTFGLFASAKEGREFAEAASEMGLNNDQLKQAAKEGVTTALGLRRIEKNTRGLGEWVSPADRLEWSEPKDKLEKIAAEFRKHYGEKVTVWGGGGAPPSMATLVRVEIHPTILKGKDGYTLKAFVKDADSMILPTEKNGDWDFWLGSWQIAVRGKGKADQEPEPQTETISPSALADNSLAENAAIHAYYDEHPEKDKTRAGRGKSKRRGSSREHKVETQMGRVGR